MIQTYAYFLVLVNMLQLLNTEEKLYRSLMNLNELYNSFDQYMSCLYVIS